MEDRMSIIVFSGTVDKLMAASILATGGAAMGMDVEVFLTTWGLEAFRKEDYKTNRKISKDFEEYGPIMMEQMMVKQVPSWMENFKNAKEVGNVKIYACSMMMELFGRKQEDLEPIVDEVTGVASFVERAKEGKITLFI
ncbi:MAG TPA: DsrE/DsrF/DrsH-like family protein [Ktedonobacteraceae bacterium]|nr:DsrE/DsrF/DrsH-like family protein [Ktedonobacteraceae bacterium]